LYSRLLRSFFPQPPSRALMNAAMYMAIIAFV
jgi:hypothetical protein